MTRPTKEIDRLIREALSESDATLAERFGEQSMPERLTEAFQGRQKLLAVGGFLAALVFFVAGIYAAVQFLQEADIRQMILWGAATAFCFAVVTSIKIWYWLEMARHSLVRELKRVELQIVQMAQSEARSRDV
jgi:hypothetical protein